jgi:hypothetical protein
MSLTFGYDVIDGDKILEAPLQMIKMLAPLALPGGALVNYLPFCAVLNFLLRQQFLTAILFSVRHIPSWVPYFSYEPLTRIGRKLSERIRNEPIDFVKNALVCGDHTLSVHV